MPNPLRHRIPKWILKHLNALLFPPLCAFCENPASELPRPFEGICRSCLAKIPFRPISEVRTLCLEHRNREIMDLRNPGDHNMDVIVACYYETMIRKALISMKFYEAAYMKHALGCIACHTVIGQKDKFDAIIPVPLHPSRMRERGYNQAGLIAAEIAGFLDIPVLEDCLVRQKNTKRQSEMNHYSDRLQNVSDAFRCVNPAILAGKRLLLVDDILTSGETMMSAAVAIRHAVADYCQNTKNCRKGSDGNEVYGNEAHGKEADEKEKGHGLEDFHLTGFVLASARRG